MSKSKTTHKTARVASTDSRVVYGRFIRRLLSSRYSVTVTVVFAVEFLVFSIYAPYFLSASNLSQIAKIASYNLIIAVGLTFLFIAAHIDLSIGANLACSSVLMALVITKYSVDPWLGALIAVTFGATVGVVSGLIVTIFRVQSFIVTLGMMSILGGGSLILTGGIPINYPTNMSSSFFRATNGTWFGVPMPAVWAVVVTALCWIILHHTKFGYHVYAVGGNPRAGREMGVKVARVTILSFGLTGGLCGLAAALQSGWLLQASPGAGASLTLDIISAIIVGGVSLFGGAGSIYGTVVGSAIIAILSSGLILIGLNSNWPQFVEGALIIVAVIFGVALSNIDSKFGKREYGKEETVPQAAK